MDARETKVVEAAIRVISRYGVKRTTMSDVAEEAGLARQTLYTVFASKEEVLRGAVRHLCANAREAILEGWQAAPSLPERLDILFEHMTLKPYELTHASPEADDIVTGFNTAAKAEIAEAYRRYEGLIAEALKPYEAGLSSKGLSVEGLSDFVRHAAMGFKQNARDLEHLRRLLADLKATVLLAVADHRHGG